MSNEKSHVLIKCIMRREDFPLISIADDMAPAIQELTGWEVENLDLEDSDKVSFEIDTFASDSNEYEALDNISWAIWEYMQLYISIDFKVICLDPHPEVDYFYRHKAYDEYFTAKEEKRLCAT